jgi:NAD(P)H-hydrate epimerase
LLIDADGLNTLSKYGVAILKEKSCEVVLTPHVLEFARLIDKEKELVFSNGISLAKEFATEYKVTILLKSAVSVITDGERVYLNVSGSSGQAKAGSGDVLSGIILGLISRMDEMFFGAVVGAYLFGKAGEVVEKRQNQYTMTASDVISALPEVINAL